MGRPSNSDGSRAISPSGSPSKSKRWTARRPGDGAQYINVAFGVGRDVPDRGQVPAEPELEAIRALGIEKDDAVVAAVADEDLRVGRIEMDRAGPQDRIPLPGQRYFPDETGGNGRRGALARLGRRILDCQSDSGQQHAGCIPASQALVRIDSRSFHRF